LPFIHSVTTERSKINEYITINHNNTFTRVLGCQCHTSFKAVATKLSELKCDIYIYNTGKSVLAYYS